MHRRHETDVQAFSIPNILNRADNEMMHHLVDQVAGHCDGSTHRLGRDYLSHFLQYHLMNGLVVHGAV